MQFDFNGLKDFLSGWPLVDLPDCPENGIFKRFHQILSEALKVGVLCSKYDFLSLLRQAMLSQSALLGVEINLGVPRKNGWPTEKEWLKFEFDIVSTNDDFIRITVKPWSPEWIVEDGQEILIDHHSNIKCQRPPSVTSDPCVMDATGFPQYTSAGQREAIRGMSFAPNGSTLVVNLPTGSGKSLVGYLPALLGKGEGELTLFIVPTVALALDQARQIKSILGGSYSGVPLAWYSGLSVEDQSLIKNNIRNGHQRILFTSPESVCGSLRWSLYDASRKGYLKYFVIDEAHLVSQWGIDFRPAFQSLSGIWRGLLGESGNAFKTILMTATLTEETLETLKILFSAPSGFQVVSAVHLRTEPRYWHFKAKDDLEQKERVIEAVRLGPRPFILYVTEPQEAEYWLDVLRNDGAKRITCFHGDTNNHLRSEIIQDWIDDRLDGIVATSAFGVGMDKSDIRMILHATVPENLDRYYQEVGRGGRDGKAMLSLLVYTEENLNRARRLAHPKVVSDELGLSRWEAMIESRLTHPEKNSIHILNLSTKPNHVKQDSDYNRAWNMRTILLMVRAGVIQLESDPPPLQDGKKNDVVNDEQIQQYLDHVLVRFLNETNHCDLDFWNTVVAKSRDKSVQSSTRNYELLYEILEQEKEVGTSLVELYQIKNFIFVSNFCGGCPACRKVGGELNKRLEPVCVVPPLNVSVDVETQWNELFPAIRPNPIIVTYTPTDGKNFKTLLPSLLETLVKMFGVREIVTSEETVPKPSDGIFSLYKFAKERFVIHRTLDEDLGGAYNLPVSRVTILHPWNSKPIPDQLLYLDKNFHMIIAPFNVPDSKHPHRLYCETETNHISINDLKIRLTL